MKRRRTLYATWHFARFLLKEFRWPLGIFLFLVFGGGLLVSLTYTRDSIGYIESCYSVYLLIFMQPELKFPSEWYLRILFFVLPIVGLGAVADSVVRLGYFIFSRKQQLQEWHVMNANAMHDHLIVVGLGKVGYRIIKELVALKEEVVSIEQTVDSHLVEEVMDLGVPVIKGDCRQLKTLEKANIAKAKAIILATDDDLANMDAALTAREVRPDIRIVLRLFDDTLARKVATVFQMPTISASQTAAPVFIAAATGRNVFHTFVLDGQQLQMVDATVEAGSTMAGRTVAELQKLPGVNVVMHNRGGNRDIGPDPSITLQAQDKLVLMAPPDKVSDLLAQARKK